MPGRFIVFDGPDGSGTTRQSAIFADRLRKEGKAVVLTAEPTESAIGQEIRGMLNRDTMPSPGAIQLLFVRIGTTTLKRLLSQRFVRGRRLSATATLFQRLSTAAHRA